MTTQYWLVKSEPEAYAWTDLVRDGRTAWTGVRNYQARIHLNAMRKGDRVFFYESVTTKAVVGLTEITKPAFPDQTAEEPGWVAVELKEMAAGHFVEELDEVGREDGGEEDGGEGACFFHGVSPAGGWKCVRLRRYRRAARNRRMPSRMKARMR